jgi:hypothetical protein
MHTASEHGWSCNSLKSVTPGVRCRAGTRCSSVWARLYGLQRKVLLLHMRHKLPCKHTLQCILCL